MTNATPSAIALSLARVRTSIAEACARARRDPSSVQLVAVSKLHPASSIRAAHEAGQRDFGENYVQELASKHAELASLDAIRWHVIGHLQRNKARDVVGRASLVHTVDSERLGVALDRACHEIDRAQLPVLVQVNVGGEAQKSGCEPDALGALLEALSALPRIAVRGLMTVPPHTDDPAESRPFFEALARLRDAHGGARSLPELSMGMTHDLPFAIEAGATIVRVGTAIFGDRPPRP
ncbi:MAG: YggS family pyridoxal phosphate-dependent enzyme [Myxococcales bacterium]|nr:YggS family pyridoxal phosphate-dependent enzyme [Myxococcales bacterium]